MWEWAEGKKSRKIALRAFPSKKHDSSMLETVDGRSIPVPYARTHALNGGGLRTVWQAHLPG